MKQRLIIAADIHGFYSTWQKFKKIIQPEDTIALAGDIFDTKYGRRDDPDFQPEKIRDELKNLSNQTYYIYGNCDESFFFPHQEYFIKFTFNNKKILIHHHDFAMSDISDVDIIISGHTHIPNLEKKEDKIFINPGALTKPKQGIPTYALLKGNTVEIIDFNNDKVLNKLSF